MRCLPICVLFILLLSAVASGRSWHPRYHARVYPYRHQYHFYPLVRTHYYHYHPHRWLGGIHYPFRIYRPRYNVNPFGTNFFDSHRVNLGQIFKIVQWLEKRKAIAAWVANLKAKERKGGIQHTLKTYRTNFFDSPHVNVHQMLKKAQSLEKRKAIAAWVANLKAKERKVARSRMNRIIKAARTARLRMHKHRRDASQLPHAILSSMDS